MERTAFTALSRSVQTAIAFVDRGVDDYQSLVAGTLSRVRFVLLDRHRDGIEQMTQVLAANHGFDEIHIISHGTPGSLQLGNARLSLETLDRYTTQLQTAFASASNLLLYGCNVAAGDAGEEFIAKLHQLTGTEIAASARRTGSAALGADWNLEVTTANFTGNLAFTSEAIAAYPFAFPTQIDNLFAHYRDLPDDTSASGNYSIKEVNDPTGSGQRILDHQFQVGSQNNLELYGFSTATTNYTVVGLVDRINIERIDNAEATGDRDILWFERESFTGNDISVKPSLSTSMEDVLLSTTINRGTDNIFANQGDVNGNNNNIERVDFISDGGLDAGTTPDEQGFLILERGSDVTAQNDKFKIAPIISLGADGKPSAYGSLTTVKKTAWNNSSFRFKTEVMRLDPGDPEGDDLRYTITAPEKESSPGQFIIGTFLTYDELGINASETFYGYSIFPSTITDDGSDGTLTSNDLVNLTNFATTTTNTGSQGGLDLIGGGGFFIVDEPPEIDLDESDTADNNYTNGFTIGGGAVSITDSDVAITDNDQANDNQRLRFATVTLTNRPDGTAESLSLNTAAETAATNAGLSVSYNSTTGELKIEGPATIAVYESIIAGIVYDNTAGTPDTTTRTINVVVNDGISDSTPTAVSTITLEENTEPTASDNTIDIDEDTPHTFEEGDFGFNDGDGDTLDTVKIISTPSNGKLQLDGVDVTDGQEISAADITSGKLKFVPDDDENGIGYADVRFQVSDGIDFSGEKTITLNVESVNDEPTFSGLDNNPNFIPEGSPVVLDSNATVSDPELDATNYDGATLILERDGGANGDDVFGNSGNLDSLTQGNALVVDGTTIGAVTTNSGGTLELTFNGNATQALVNQVLQQITYSNSSTTPPASAQINYTFGDGNTGTQGTGNNLSGTGSITVNIGSTPPPVVVTPPTTPPTTDPSTASTPEPEITVSTSGTSDIPDGTDTPQNLGSSPVGTPFTQTFTVENTGTADLILDSGSLTLPDGFTLVGEFPETVTPGSSATFTVELDTSTPGSYGGTISFTNNDADEGTFDFPVTVTVGDNSPTRNTPDVPQVAGVSTPVEPTAEVAATHDDCCCPTAPTLDGVFVEPIPGFNFTLEQLPAIENTLTGSNNNDSLLGTTNNDAILGLAGDDRADGSDGDDLLVGGLSSSIPVGSGFDRDTLYGNQGNDVILGNEGDDRINAGKDNDVVFAGKDNDRVEGEMGEDTLLGEQGNDTVIGGTGDRDFIDPGADLIYGGIGNDELYGNQGNDSISGGTGDDLAYGGKEGDLLSGEAGNDTLKGEQGNDTILGSLGSTSEVGAAADRDWLSGNEGNDLIKGGQGEDTIYAGRENDLVYGGKDGDLIFGDKGSDTLSGDLGNDTISGGTSQFDDPEGVNDGDVIFGGAGDDVIDGNLGNDNIVGGTGNDTISGGQQDDLIWGEAGNDLLFGDLGNDSVCGGEGNDTLIGSNGNPLSTADGDDKLCGGAGDDRVFGNEGNDKLTGNAGEDWLYGGRGDDTITGGSQTDVLSGEQGNDVLTGGTEGDRFDFAQNHGMNIITDFTDGEDIIGLQGGMTFAQLAVSQVGNDTQITAGELSITLQGVNASAIGSDDFALV
ncbi:DUF4347 domain-containing protein [Oscillatoriales cyanobacterium LEGE 11467]|uniref:DUF4347 domain-containing protein n=1 Tax=Zarconia navalis LEGE 11467 TaxID=1828826 RepID=A0A928VY46_9CYAN|nr:DUF4347 domain-containing protein [Zarconia navalis]MBE9039810.1 DUF4347 domain-containing protein [Zarconia navalis LEGE 11467]